MRNKIISIILNGVLMLRLYSANITVNKNLESGKIQGQIQLKLLNDSDHKPW